MNSGDLFMLRSNDARNTKPKFIRWSCDLATGRKDVLVQRVLPTYYQREIQAFFLPVLFASLRFSISRAGSVAW
jgi:hypothetical protein